MLLSAISLAPTASVAIWAEVPHRRQHLRPPPPRQRRTDCPLWARSCVISLRATRAWADTPRVRRSKSSPSSPTLRSRSPASATAPTATAIHATIRLGNRERGITPHRHTEAPICSRALARTYGSTRASSTRASGAGSSSRRSSRPGRNAKPGRAHEIPAAS
jgi:hypothetical protein